jgi:hypothetical protein
VLVQGCTAIAPPPFVRDYESPALDGRRVILPQPGESSRYHPRFIVALTYHRQWLMGAGG